MKTPSKKKTSNKKQIKLPDLKVRKDPKGGVYNGGTPPPPPPPHI